MAKQIIYTMENTPNVDADANILDYALMLLKSTENLQKTLEHLTEEMQKNNPNVISSSEVKLKGEKIKNASSMMKIMQKLRRKKKRHGGGKSSGSSVSSIKGQVISPNESSHKLKKNASEKSLVESVIKTDVYREMTPKPSVPSDIHKSELQLARKTISRQRAAVKSNSNSNSTLIPKTQHKSNEMHFDDSLFNVLEFLISAWIHVKNQLI